MLASVTTSLLRAATPLPAEFYLRPADQVAPELIGKIFVHRVGRLWLAARIVEVEAYLGDLDPASHAFKGETKRNGAMFGPGGACYVYLSYGVHHCMNVVTERAGQGQGCLLRAVQPLLHVARMAEQRGLPPPQTPKQLQQITNGPGKLTQALAIGPQHNGQRFDQSGFKLVSLPGSEPSEVRRSPRVGISKAVDLPLRFTELASPFISKPFPAAAAAAASAGLAYVPRS